MIDKETFIREMKKADVNPKVDILTKTECGLTLINPDNIVKLINDIRENILDMTKLINDNILNAEITIDQESFTDEQVKAFTFIMLSTYINGENDLLDLFVKTVSSPFVSRERYLTNNGLDLQYARLYVGNTFDTYQNVSHAFKMAEGIIDEQP